MKRYEVWLEHDRGADLHLIDADTREAAGKHALANAEAPNARIVRIDG